MISYFPVVTGSLTVEGSVNISGGITASGGISISGSISSASFASTASFVALAQSASNAVSAQTASFANTLTVAGNLTAQTLVVQTITSSVDFVTGSTRFGSIADNTHQFTGSVGISGSLTGASAIFGGLLTTNVPTDNTTVGIFHAGGGTANRGLKISTFISVNDNAGVRLDAQTTAGGATLALATAGVDRLSISSTGAATFTTNSNSTITNVFQNTNTTDTNSRNYFNVVAGNVTTSIQSIHNDHSYINVTNHLYLQSGGSVKMTMLSNGNVGIGTTGPASTYGFTRTLSIENATNAELQLKGSTAIMSIGTTVGLNYFQSNVGYEFQTGGTAKMTIPSAGGINTNNNTIYSAFIQPGSINNGASYTYTYQQTSAEYQVVFEYCIVGLYAPSGTNLNGITLGYAAFFADGSTNSAYNALLIQNGWGISVSATNAGAFSIVFTNGGGATMSNVNIRIRKVNRTNAG